MATKRRKGEKPVVHSLLLWSKDGPIAHKIKTGDHWLYAWIAQQAVPMPTLSRRSGVSLDRLDALWRGHDAAADELEALSGPFCTDVASLRASIAFERAVRAKLKKQP